MLKVLFQVLCFISGDFCEQVRIVLFRFHAEVVQNSKFHSQSNHACKSKYSLARNSGQNQNHFQ